MVPWVFLILFCLFYYKGGYFKDCDREPQTMFLYFLFLIILCGLFQNREVLYKLFSLCFQIPSILAGTTVY